MKINDSTQKTSDDWRSPDITLISDHLRDDADESFSYRLFPEQLDCIRTGDPEGLKQTFTPEIILYYKEAIPDLFNIPQLFSFLCGCCQMLAIEGGLPLARGAAISTKYLRIAPYLKSVLEFVQILQKMQLEWAEEVSVHKRFASENAIVNTCTRYIYEHIDEKFTIKQLAEACACSPSHLQHLFKKHMSLSLTDYIRKEKIEKACILLKHTDQSCAAISQKLSFSSQSYFIKQFAREKGTTPSQYIKQYQPPGTGTGGSKM